MGTERFEDYIRQVKLSLIFLPLGVSKSKMETALVEFMSHIPEKFSYIYTLKRANKFFPMLERVMTFRTSLVTPVWRLLRFPECRLVENRNVDEI